MLRALAVLAATSIAISAHSAAAPAAPPSQMPAYVTDALDRGDGLIAPSAVATLGGEAREDAALEPLTGLPQPAFRVTTNNQPAHHYSIEARVPASASVKKGDVLFAAWWMRAHASRVESGEAVTLFRVQRTQPPWERTLYGDSLAGPEWKLIYRAGRAPADIPAGELAAVFSAGYPRQAFDVAGLRVSNLGPDADPDTLPTMTISYPGAEPDAAWRIAAEARIDRLRRADLTLELVDADGQPLRDAQVEAELVRHDFWFGSAFAADWLYDNWDTPDGARYREKMIELFNGVAMANQLKWARWEQNPDIAMTTLRWLKGAGLKTHGHVLVWPGLEKFRVADAKQVWAAAQSDPDILRDRVRNHMVDILTATHGLVDDWDVVNEPYTQHEFLDLLGQDAMVDWFKLARELAPNANLFLNDFSILAGNGLNKPKQDFMYDTAAYLLEQGAPIDAIGFQAHMGGGLTPPYRLEMILNRFEELGLPIMITEFDVDVPDPEVQEQYARDFMTVMFSHPAVSGFTTWGFWRPQMWSPNSAMFDADWNLMPVGRAFTGLVHDAWKTRAAGRSDAAGRFAFRGFKGDYRVTVTVDGETTTHEVQLPTLDGTIRLEPSVPAGH
ncbi:MAG: endo-1,4-beta-xylanase [Planctomycetota bacterium]